MYNFYKNRHNCLKNNNHHKIINSKRLIISMKTRKTEKVSTEKKEKEIHKLTISFNSLKNQATKKLKNDNQRYMYL